MNDALVLKHPAFDRPPVLNARRRGPTPRGIPMLHRERWERRNEFTILRRWADEHGVKPAYGIYDYDKLRELKTQQEAREVAEAGLYGGELRDIEEMKDVVAQLYRAVSTLYNAITLREKRILEQAAQKAVTQIAHDDNLPSRCD
ncbi:hypothetical protein [Burkholderia cepacia]|uniref:hypothetical protein n=2 Tax=Burkholderia cepacia complex TaxID=87882 RepID=UPI000A457BD0|nr:hypothetical protein [Burkholderia cepacia]